MEPAALQALADRQAIVDTIVRWASALDEHGAPHIVAAAGVGQQLVEQVAAARMVPEVMVGIADRQAGLEDVFHIPPEIVTLA